MAGSAGASSDLSSRPACGDDQITPGRPGRPGRIRPAMIWVLGTAGLITYNWWLLVPLKPGLMRSPDELFSNLEVSGQPYATAMQRADLASGLLLIAAFWLARPGRRTGRRDRAAWLAMIGFAAAGAAGGLFPEVCADGVNAACRQLEWHFQLPASQYIHMIAGVFEFFFITLALALAVLRSRGQHSRAASVYRRLARAALVAYPLLGAAYLLNRMGGVMEAVFFTGFTVMVVAQLAERVSALRMPQRTARDAQARPATSACAH